MGTTASATKVQSNDVIQVLVPKEKFSAQIKRSQCAMCQQINSQLENERESLADEKAKVKKLQEENQDLKIKLSDLEIDNSKLCEELVILESQFETTTTTNPSNENYQQLIDTKNKTIQNLESQLASKTNEINEMKQKHDALVAKFKAKIENLKKENALKLFKLNDEITRHETENTLLNETINTLSDKIDMSSTMKLIVELSNHINEKDTVILQLNNDVKEKDNHIALLSKKLKKYKTKTKHQQQQHQTQQQNSFQSKSLYLNSSRNNSAPSPRHLHSSNHNTSNNNKFIIKEFAFETEIISDTEPQMPDVKLNDLKEELLDSSISSILD